MGLMINGEWDADATMIPVEAGRYVREPSKFRHAVSADGSSGFPAARGRYHLYVAYHCPWAWRTMLYRRLKGLEDVISMTIAIPNDRRNGWQFGDFPGGCTPDSEGFTHLHRVYAAAQADYTGNVSVPVLWDKQQRTIVNNESSEIIRMLNSAFEAYTDQHADYYPEALRPAIDEVNERVYAGLNNGVYRVGFATEQGAYEEALEVLFSTLDWLDDRLAHSRYLVGDTLTEADWRLLPTLLRFDLVYYALFRCSLRQIASYPQLTNYLRELYQHPGVAELVNLPHFMRGYFSIPRTNPTGIIPPVPLGYEAWLGAPHDRARL